MKPVVMMTLLAFVAGGCGSRRSVDGGGGEAAGRLSPLYASLFQKGKTFTYGWTFEVDSHAAPDDEGGEAEAEAPSEPDERTVDCRVQDVVSFGDARVATVECVARGEDADDIIEPALSATWVGSPKGLWLADETIEDADGAMRLLDTEPFLPASPVEREWTEVIDGMDGEAEARHGIVREGKGFCRVYEDDEMYGSVERRCFLPGLGLASAFFAGREGPSTESYGLDTTK
ncbi:MAG: hypothetical protein IT385_09620 [Deltaproteobacteria bacterium]|nr:hypothetical protein [Deltaproteobacteria bacterium]